MLRNKVKAQLESLKVTDVYSLILFALYKIKDIPQYSTLSELAYVLDKDSFFKFLECFGGLTITIPTLKDFKLIVYGLMMYQFVNLEKMEFNEALEKLDITEYQSREVKETYLLICDILKEYNFG